MDIDKQIEQIPLWKRVLVCLVLRRREWKIARAYNVVARDLLKNTSTSVFFDDLQKLGNLKWAALYDLDTAPGDLPERSIWQSRAERAERALTRERERRVQLENNIEVLMRALTSRKESRRLRTPRLP